MNTICLLIYLHIHAISGRLHTVPVMSRVAYITLSAGTRVSVCPTMQHPTSSRISTILLEGCETPNPGMDSSLSRVPPVCPNPLPDIIGIWSKNKMLWALYQIKLVFSQSWVQMYLYSKVWFRIKSFYNIFFSLYNSHHLRWFKVSVNISNDVPWFNIMCACKVDLFLCWGISVY